MWKVLWLELDKQWLVVSPFGTIERRFYSLTQAREYVDACQAS